MSTCSDFARVDRRLDAVEVDRDAISAETDREVDEVIEFLDDKRRKLVALRDRKKVANEQHRVVTEELKALRHGVCGDCN